MTLRVVSHGGGRQTTAMLVLAAQERIPYRTFLFANVGDDSESPETLTYFHEHAQPFAKRHGIELIELRRVMRDGSVRTLREEVLTQERSVPIPIRLEGGGFGRRNCTKTFKIQVIGRWTKAHGATPDDPAEVAIGFSIDELHRASDAYNLEWQRKTYPLFDLRLTKADCIRIIADAGLPVPPKSACSFCPFHNIEDWRRLARENPERFAEDVELERIVSERHQALRGDKAWFSPLMRPLPAVMDQQGFWDDDGPTCDTESCFT